MSDDTPTQRIPQDELGEELVEERKKSRTLMYILIGIGAVLIIAIIVLLIFLFGGNNGAATADPTTSSSPSASPTESATPTPTATPTPEPVPTVTVTAAPPQPADDGNVKVQSFSVSPTTCNTPGETVTLQVKWKSTNGNIAYFGVNTGDAQSAGMGWDLPASGSDADFPAGYSPYQVTCPTDTVNYTITVVGNGSKASKTVTLRAQ